MISLEVNPSKRAVFTRIGQVLRNETLQPELKFEIAGIPILPLEPGEGFLTINNWNDVIGHVSQTQGAYLVEGLEAKHGNRYDLFTPANGPYYQLLDAARQSASVLIAGDCVSPYRSHISEENVWKRLVFLWTSSLCFPSGIAFAHNLKNIFRAGPIHKPLHNRRQVMKAVALGVGSAALVHAFDRCLSLIEQKFTPGAITAGDWEFSTLNRMKNNYFKQDGLSQCTGLTLAKLNGVSLSAILAQNGLPDLKPSAILDTDRLSSVYREKIESSKAKASEALTYLMRQNAVFLLNQGWPEGAVVDYLSHLMIRMSSLSVIGPNPTNDSDKYHVLTNGTQTLLTDHSLIPGSSPTDSYDSLLTRTRDRIDSLMPEAINQAEPTSTPAVL